MKNFLSKIIQVYRAWPLWGKITFWVFIPIYVLSLMNNLFPNDVDIESSPQTQESASAENETSNSPPTLEERQAQVENDVKRLFRGNTSYGEPKFKEAAWAPEGYGGVSLYMHGEESFFTSTKQGLYVDSISIFKKLFPNYDFLDWIRIIWNMQGVDVSGNNQVFQAMFLVLRREDFEKVNWSEFLYRNLPLILDEYWQHPTYFED